MTQAPRSLLAGSLGQLLIRGLIAGFVAGLLAGTVAYVTGEQHIDAAIAIEEAHPASSHDHSAATGEAHSDEEPLISRDGQRAGLFLATALSGAAFGAIYACVLAVARNRARLPALQFIVAVGAAGWFAVAAVPFLKYPANPPAVGDPDTITERTVLWFAMVALGLLAASAFAYTHAVVRARSSSSVLPVLLPTVAAISVVLVGYAVTPAIDEVPADFPASLLWQFRLSSVLTQLTLWASIIGVFAVLSERAARPGIPEKD